MLEIRENGNYLINQNQVSISELKEATLVLTTDCEIALSVIGETRLHLINETAKDISLSCSVQGELILTMASLAVEDMKFSLKVDLLTQGAKIKTLNAGICRGNQELYFLINHLSEKTYSSVSNYGIALENSSYDCEIVGVINKGSKDSEAYQTSRVLTTKTPRRVKVQPILQMGEKEIKAKHACSIGRLADEQKYYLASRGLDEEQIIFLTARSYLSSILAEIADEKLSIDLQEKIESQVRNLCLM